ncbi:MAG: DUF58 domain-containing protein [Terriglobia bacterium]
MRNLLQQVARRYPALRPWAERLSEKESWSGAKNFFLALLLLGIALVLALNGAAAFERRELGWMALYHTLALALTGYVTLKLVPAMARGTPLRWFFYQIDYQVTKEGVVYLAAMVVVMGAALNTGNNLLFLILASLLAGILVSGAVSRMVLTGIELALDLPEHVFARQPVVASLTLTNHKRTLPSFSLTVSAEESVNGKRKTRTGGTDGSRRVLRAPVYFPYVPRFRHATQRVQLTFPCRGRYAQNVLQVSSKFPFGFLLKTRRLDAAQELVVYPPVEPTEEFYEILPLISGEMESTFKGRGHDLYSIRDFQPGDSARQVDWKATAKAQRLQVREFTREDERRVELIFDPFLPAEAHGTGWEKRFERAVTFCACLAWHFYEINAQLRFRSPDWGTPVAPACDIIYDVLRHLALIEARRPPQEGFLRSLGQNSDTFKIILTAQPRGSIPTGLWTSSYFVFMQSL